MMERKDEFGPVAIDPSRIVVVKDDTTDVGELHLRAAALGIDGVTRVGGETVIVLAEPTADPAAVAAVVGG